MKIKPEVVLKIIGQLDAILARMEEDEKAQIATLEAVSTYYPKSAQNLLNYISFRSFDVREIQKHLKNMGLTRFANAEAHIKASVMTIRYILALAVSHNEQDSLSKHWSIKKGKKLLDRNTKKLLGKGTGKRRVRIMVTQPSEAATNYEMVRNMVASGMDCARINCAHDSAEVWEKIIENIKKAAEELERDVKIAMDLAGPKIRTGKITPGPRVLRYKPTKDDYGKVTEPRIIRLVADKDLVANSETIPIMNGALHELQEGMVLTLVDARSKHRKLKVIAVDENEATVQTKQTIYVTPNLVITTAKESSLQWTVGEVPTKEGFLLLFKGDELRLMKENTQGTPAVYDETGKVLEPAMISCQMPAVFDYVKEGDRVFFDDGKIGGTIVSVESKYCTLKIDLAKETGSKLKEEKGINFPDTLIGFSGLTAKDKADLPFVAKHADIVNFSFVNRKEDVKELHAALANLASLDSLAVVLKIETQAGYENLVSILLEAMKGERVGVMIARGDLAIETGWENIGQVQQEILSICGAAHVPVIWATQVLENLAKNGLPSRSEITDATTALKAECVMLNKGPYILQAIELLDTILCRMESSQHKNEPMLPKLQALVNNPS